MRVFLTVILSVAIALGGIIAAEVSLPLDLKPSVLLRVSTGEIPSNLEQSLDTEKIHSERMALEVHQAQEDASGLAASIVRIEAAREALIQRVQEKGAEFNYYLGGS
jgi:hypothetical protein